MPLADRPLDEILRDLESWLLTLKPGAAPSWRRLLLAECRNVDYSRVPTTTPALRVEDLMTATAFEARWREAVDLGLAGWINLSAQGVWGDALVVLLEPPSRGEPHSHMPDQISVNFSGPNLGSDWRAERQLDIQT